MGSSGGPEVEVHVLGHPKGGAAEGHEGQLGACPFSHRVLLVLEEKGVPYRPNYVDVAQKPAWVSEVSPAGTLPILKDLASGQWLTGSDTISDFLEDKFPTAEGKKALRLGHVADCPNPAPQLWPKFLAFLGATPDSEEEAGARSELEEQLQAVEKAVPNEHPYLGGAAGPCASDCALAPRLYLARQGCKLLKGWDWADEECPDLKAYLHRMTGRPAWRNSASWDDDCIAADLRRKMRPQ